MKKAMWTIALIALVGTAAFLPFLPETVPVHFDAYWQPDRWGSRLELLLLPVLLLICAGVMAAVLDRLEKKATDGGDDKARAGAGTNAKALGIAGVSMIAVLALIQVWLLFRIHRAAAVGYETAGVLDRLPFMLVGIIHIVLGNIMPKTRRNGVIGFRVTWTLYSDETWRRTHRFGGYVLAAAGILLVIAAALIPSPLTVTAVLLVLVTGAVLVTLVYARRVYLQEKERSDSHEA